MSGLGWMYFGCGDRPGHYLFGPRMGPVRMGWEYQRRLETFDAKLAPQLDKTPYMAALTRLGGWDLSALSWWDHTVDKRGGSNSIVFAPGSLLTPDQILDGFREFFPPAWKRMPTITLPQGAGA